MVREHRDMNNSHEQEEKGRRWTGDGKRLTDTEWVKTLENNSHMFQSFTAYSFQKIVELVAKKIYSDFED